MPAIDDAIEHLKAGRIVQAEALLQPLTATGDADALHLFGLVRDSQGRLDEAEILVRQAIDKEPRAANFVASLAMILAKKDDHTGAVEAASQAVALAPYIAGLHHNYALALVRADRLDEAEEEYREAIAIDPRLARSHECLGHLLVKRGNDTDGLAALLKAIELDPTSTDALLNATMILFRREEFTAAEKLLRRALEVNPNHVPCLTLLAMYESSQGHGQHAHVLAKRAVELAPKSADAWVALGDACAAIGKPADARAAFDVAQDLKPDDSNAIVSAVALLWYVEGTTTQSMDRLQRALERNPNDPLLLEAAAYSSYLNGDSRTAIQLGHRSLEIDPNRLSSRSLLIFLQYQDDSTPREERFRLAVDWGRIAARTNKRMPPPVVEGGADRRLRVGYLCGTFRNHPVGYAIAPVLAQHDLKVVDVVLYANQQESDETTEQIRRSMKRWEPCANMSDAQLCDLIREHKIDILVDLAGHSAGHRLEVFVRKPAPIQVTWNYSATTGIPAIDWVIADHVVMPKDEEQWFVERPWFLPGANAPIPPVRIYNVVGPPPSNRTGFITFGCFNNLAKVTEQNVELWSRILKRVKGSRLLMRTFALNSERTREQVRERFAKHGIKDELVLAPGALRLDFLRGYADIDISLDPFPYNGGMSTLESAFMGVPVVMMMGDSYCSRMGATLATHVGCPELVAHSEDEYIAIAERLATHPEELSMLRAQLRGLLQRAADPKNFARNLEAAFRGMWLDYLKSQQA